MGAETLVTRLFETITQHIPPGMEWAPATGAGVLAVVGLVFMIKGAKLALVLAALVFALVGGAAGGQAAGFVPVPSMACALVGGAIGLTLGIVLFRFWFALLVAFCLVGAALTVYGAKVAQPAINDYQIRGLELASENGPGITLPDADESTESPVSEVAWRAEAVDFWNYLGQEVPNFQASFVAIVITTGLAGLILGLLLPKTARAFWAATVGVGVFLPAVYALLHEAWPAGAAWVQDWGLTIAATLWGISLLVNLSDMFEKRPKKVVVADDRTAKA